MLLGQPVRQIAYFVKDVRAAASRHSMLFGSGPYFAMKFPTIQCLHRGRKTELDISCAAGQWGSVMVEFLQQDKSGPSVLHDLYPEKSGRTGLHHVACIVDDLNSAIKNFAKAGITEVNRFLTPEGDCVHLDALENHAHFIEIYEPLPSIMAIYRMVADAAVGFDGKDAVRELC